MSTLVIGYLIGIGMGSIALGVQTLMFRKALKQRDDLQAKVEELQDFIDCVESIKEEEES